MDTISLVKRCEVHLKYISDQTATCIVCFEYHKFSFKRSIQSHGVLYDCYDDDDDDRKPYKNLLRKTFHVILM